MTEAEFRELLTRPEGETLDVKRKLHDLSSSQGQGDFVKDVLAMANTPRDRSSYIVLGVHERGDGRRDLDGITVDFDEVSLQNQLRDRVYPVPVCRLSVVRHAGKEFAVIEILPERIGPCVPVRTYPRLKLTEGQVWFRRGSRNDVAKAADLQRIHEWIHGHGIVNARNAHVDIVKWPEFIEAVRTFEANRRYILVAHPFSGELADTLSPLGKIPWAAAIDFDPSSDTAGLLAAVAPVLGIHRNVRRAVMGNQPTINFDSTTLWYFARGFSGRDDTVETGPWRRWVNRYQTELTNQFQRLAAALSPSPVTCVVLWHNSDLTNHVDTTIQAAYGSFGDVLETAFITGDNLDVSMLAEKYDATQFAIPWDGLARGIDATMALDAVGAGGKCLVPGSHGEPVELAHDKVQWLRDELTLVDSNIGRILPEDHDPRRDFLCGSEITWFALGTHCDVDRDKTTRLKSRIETELRTRRTSRVNLYHAPGGGGTTVAKRVLWDFHERYPAVILHRTQAAETADRLFTITSSTSQPILVLIDGSEIAERDVDALYQLLSSRHIPAVILQVLRRFQPQREGPRAVYLPADLSVLETARFVEQYALVDQTKKHALELLQHSDDRRARTAFYFGLTTFGKDFLGLTPYVEQRLSGLSLPQRQIVGYLAHAHHYAQRALPAQTFRDVLGLSPQNTVDLTKALPDGTLELLVEVGAGRWRTAHELIAEEVLVQLLTPADEDRRKWRQQLARWTIDFARLCRGDETVPSEELLEVARRTFVYRDNANLLGTERAGANRFSQLIEDIPSPIGQENVLRELAELYPDEAHFQAHLARFFALQVRDYDEAQRFIDRAIALQDTDHVLHHVRGTVLRSQVYQAIEEDADLDEIVKIAEAASESFERSRSINPDNEHGFISEAQMLIRVLDYCGSKHARGVLGFLSQRNVSPLVRDSVERTEDLLDHVRAARESEGESPYERDCRARLSALLSDHEMALQTWNSLLDPKKGVYKPPIRRQLVWTYLRRRGSWDTLPSKEVSRIVDLLQNNLSEEPNKDTNLRLWVRAVRRLEDAPSPPAGYREARLLEGEHQLPGSHLLSVRLLQLAGP